VDTTDIDELDACKRLVESIDTAIMENRFHDAGQRASFLKSKAEELRKLCYQLVNPRS